MKDTSRHVLLLNGDYSVISVIDWRKAIRLIAKGKVQVIEYKADAINYGRGSYEVPSIIALREVKSALKKKNIGVTRNNVARRDNHTCAYCGRHLGKNIATVDHVMPRSKGGQHTWHNTVAACKPCNNKKGDKLLEELGWKLLFKPRFPNLQKVLFGHFLEAEENSSWKTFFGDFGE